MKSLMIGLLVASALLTACGKKGKGSSAPGPAPVNATGACTLNQFGSCVGGIGQSGVVPANIWEGNVAVVDGNKYRQFLTENGLCYGFQCQNVSGFFKLAVQTIRDSNVPGAPTAFATLPGAVNFKIAPRMNGWYGRELRTQGDGYVNAGGNGFQVVYNRMLGGGYPYYQQQPGLMGQPYMYPQQPLQPFAGQTNSLQIVLTFADATQTIASVTVIYQGVQMAAGQIRGRYVVSPNVMSSLNGINSQGNGPEVAPYRRQ